MIGWQVSKFTQDYPLPAWAVLRKILKMWLFWPLYCGTCLPDPVEPDPCIVDLRQPRSKMKMEKGNLLGLFTPEVCLGTSIRSSLPGSGLGVTWRGHPPPSWPRPRGNTFLVFWMIFFFRLSDGLCDWSQNLSSHKPQFYNILFISNFGDLSSWQSKQPGYRNSPVALVPSPTQLFWFLYLSPLGSQKSRPA